MDFEDIFPFLQFFIDYISSDEIKEMLAETMKIKRKKEKRLKGWVSETENWNYNLEDGKKKMISYKNSVLINNHFKEKLNIMK